MRSNVLMPAKLRPTRQVEKTESRSSGGAAVLKKCLINQCSHRVMGLSPRDLAHHPLYPFHVLIPFSLGVRPILCFFTWPVLLNGSPATRGKKRNCNKTRSKYSWIFQKKMSARSCDGTLTPPVHALQSDLDSPTTPFRIRRLSRETRGFHHRGH